VLSGMSSMHALPVASFWGPHVLMHFLWQASEGHTCYRWQQLMHVHGETQDLHHN